LAYLANEFETLEPQYDVVVVGSGYGGSIAASRMARARQRVCLFEKGLEYQPGEYPDTELEALAHMQMDSPDGHVGSANGLYEFHVNPEINIFKGCGLGGTSLVNANVALRAEPRVYEDPNWPAAFRRDSALMEKCYGWAEAMLKPTPYPDDQPELKKLSALAESADGLGPSLSIAATAVATA